MNVLGKTCADGTVLQGNIKRGELDGTDETDSGQCRVIAPKNLYVAPPVPGGLLHVAATLRRP